MIRSEYTANLALQANIGRPAPIYGKHFATRGNRKPVAKRGLIARLLGL